MKHNYTLLIFVVGVIFVIGCTTLEEISSKKINGIVIPSYVSIMLSQSILNNERIPLLVLYGGEYGGCYRASNIIVDESYSKDVLLININGYYSRTISGDGCPADIVPITGEVKVNIDWLKESKENQVNFILNGHENRFVISYNQFRVKLAPIYLKDKIGERNVGIDIEKARTQKQLQYSTEGEFIQITLYPSDVGVLYLAGDVKDKEYRVILTEFAENRGLMPVEKIYPDFKQSKKDRLYVVVRNMVIPNPYLSEPSINLGKLPSESNVEVYLSGLIETDYEGD